MVKEKIQGINWNVVIYVVTTLIAVGGFVAMTKAKCEQVDDNRKEIEINKRDIAELKVTIASQSKDIQYIKEGIDDIKRKL